MMFWIMVLMAISGLIATDLFVPSLPVLAETFHQPANHIELTITLFLMGFAASQLFYGPVSDRMGRKAPIILGVSLFCIGSLSCLLAPSFAWLCVGRIIQGIGAGSGLSLSRVVLRDLYQGTSLAIKSSQMAIFICISPAIAPCVGGWLQAGFGYKAPFVFMLLYGLFLLTLLLTQFKETIRHRDTELTLSNTLKHYAELLRNFMFMRYVTTAGIGFGAVILYANIIPFIVQNQLHYTATENGYILLCGALGLTFTALIGSKIVHRFHAYHLTITGLILLLLSGMLMIITEYFMGTHVIPLVILLFMTTMSCGLLLPNSLALAFSNVHVKIGIAGAIYGTTQILIAMGINFVLNTISHQTQSLLGTFYVVMGIFGLALILLRKHSSSLPSNDERL